MTSRLRPLTRLTQHTTPRIPLRPFTSAASHPASKTQLYISRTSDPLVNLSLEHRLLQTSHPDSTVLVLYVNRPTVVFGRNQNPWLEVNLGKLAAQEGKVGLVRRRSGGGTVFHDEGNVNFGVICPPAVFDRDRHAEMVVRALKTLGQPTARVNERHDIVVDVDDALAGDRTRKVSGSAYKLTRLRSLHHGTCLVRSPNLGLISPLLRSPAEPYINARGVDSVRSPVANVNLGIEEFKDAVVKEFEQMYGEPHVKEEFGDEVLEDESILAGVRELGARAWLYGQTPKFAFSTSPTDEDPRERPNTSIKTGVYFEAKRGVIDRFELDGVSKAELVGLSLCDIDWTSRLLHNGESGQWMGSMLGSSFTREV